MKSNIEIYEEAGREIDGKRGKNSKRVKLILLRRCRVREGELRRFKVLRR